MTRCYKGYRYNGNVVQKVARTIAKFGMLRPGDRVGVAVSGGADSVSLLHCLAELAERLRIGLSAVHVNHELRGAESEADQAFVGRLADRLQLRFFTKALNAAGEAERQRDNLEQAARNSRYQWFTELIRQGHFERIATGHTRSDQAETVLFRFLRGAGSAGLSSIRPVRHPGIVRPLLEVDRDDVLTYLRQNGREWREDSSNQRRDFARNRIRHELLPSLMRDWNPRLPRVLAQTAEWAQAEEEYWSTVVAELAPRYLWEEGEACCLRAADLQALPLALRRRLLRFAIGRARGDLRRIDFEHVEAVDRLISSPRGTGAVELPGLTITRSQGGLRLLARNAAAQGLVDYNWAVQPPARFPIPGEATEIALDLVETGQRTPPIRGWADKEEGYNNNGREHLDWDRLPKPLWLRNWRPGDRYRPAGREGVKKLKTLFQEHKVAAWARHGWPVIAASRRREDSWKRHEIGDSQEDVIVWARQFGTAAEFKAGPESKVVLEITERGQ